MDAIHLPNGITLPTTFGAPGTPLQAGQLLQALVLELIESDVFRLQLPQATLDVRSDVALALGSTITLAVKGGGQGIRLVIYSDAAPSGQGSTAGNLAGREPIGEAVVIARPAPVRDAAPLSLLDAARGPTPEQALGEAVRSAAPRQAGLAPLFADVEQALQRSVPLQVRAAAADVLALRVPLDEQLTASDLKQALLRSGVLLEPRLAAGTPPEAANDLKAALLVLRQVLKLWSANEPAAVRSSNLPLSASTADLVRITQPGNSAALTLQLTDALAVMPDGPPLSPEQATSLAKTLAGALAWRDPPSAQTGAGPTTIPPPFRGAALSAQPPAESSLALDATPRDAAEHLLAATDGALARTTLLQVASLPDQPDLPRADAAQRWSFEVPFATAQGTAMAQFEVSRDGRSANPDLPARVWRARFSLDVEPMGPVHAMIALTGARASVTLWAERVTTATQLNESAPLLRDALRAAELEPADFQARVGAPPAAKPAAPGRFMDRAS